MKRFLCGLAAAVALGSCRDAAGQGGAPYGQRAADFAEHFYNYELQEAAAMATPESAKWLSFVASNVSDDDLEQLNADGQPATATVADVLLCDDSTAVVTLQVEHFLEKDTIGRPSRWVDEATVSLTVVRRGSRYYVRMEGLPQSERPGRD